MSATSTGFSFSIVDVIEWLGPTDRPTGTEVAALIRQSAHAHSIPVEVRHRGTNTSGELRAHITDITKDFIAAGRRPIIHIETHGCIDGIGVPGGDYITWRDLQTELTPLNQALGLGLLVLVGACEGIWGLQMNQPADRATFYCLIGPPKPIDEDALFDCWSRFYPVLFACRDAVAAFHAANEGKAGPERSLNVTTAEFLFELVVAEYLRDRCREDALIVRETTITDNLIKRVRAAQGREPSELEVAEMRRLAGSQIRDHSARLTETFEHFFFIDLFPGNRERFRTALDRALAAAPGAS